MAIELKMPALSPTMEEGTLAKWLVKEGDEVSSGDIIAEIETDKATMEFEAVDEGTIGKLLVEEGTENVAVGTVIATMAGDSEDIANIKTPPPTKMPPGEGEKVGQEPSQAQITKDEASPQPKIKSAAADPEIPRGTNMATITVREALRDGMAEEIAARRPCVCNGRGSRRISGRLQGYTGFTRGVRSGPRDRYSDHRIWLCRDWDGRGDGRSAAHRGVHDVQFRYAGDRPYRELSG